MPSRFNCSPRLTASLTACAIPLLPLSFRPHRSRGLHFDSRLIAQGADYFEAPGDDPVAVVQPAHNLDIGGAGNPGLHFSKHGLIAGDDKHSLNLLFL